MIDSDVICPIRPGMAMVGHPEHDVQVKSFDELSKEELFEILRARDAVSIAEQECPYQDIDDIDIRSIHVFVRLILRKGIETAIWRMGAKRMVAETQTYVRALYGGEDFGVCLDVFWRTVSRTY